LTPLTNKRTTRKVKTIQIIAAKTIIAIPNTFPGRELQMEFGVTMIAANMYSLHLIIIILLCTVLKEIN